MASVFEELYPLWERFGDLYIRCEHSFKASERMGEDVKTSLYSKLVNACYKAILALEAHTKDVQEQRLGEAIEIAEETLKSSCKSIIVDLTERWSKLEKEKFFQRSVKAKAIKGFEGLRKKVRAAKVLLIAEGKSYNSDKFEAKTREACLAFMKIMSEYRRVKQTIRVIFWYKMIGAALIVCVPIVAVAYVISKIYPLFS